MSAATASVPIVTIDGPSSSGKGTISRIVASRVGWHLLDSGALYRLVALGGILRNLDPDDVEEHVAVARVHARGIRLRGRGRGAASCSTARTSPRRSARSRPGRAPPGWPPGRRSGRP